MRGQHKENTSRERLTRGQRKGEKRTTKITQASKEGEMRRAHLVRNSEGESGGALGLGFHVFGCVRHFLKEGKRDRERGRGD